MCKRAVVPSLEQRRGNKANRSNRPTNGRGLFGCLDSQLVGKTDDQSSTVLNEASAA
jgi:hypothetical protein